MASDEFERGARNTVARRDRAGYRIDDVIAVLDEAPFVSVGIVEDGRPVVIPMLHTRSARSILFHGSPRSRLLRRLSEGIDVCISATIIDGLVLARSAFAHSANYRSVVVFGRSRRIEDLAGRREALDAITDSIVPGRRSNLRPMTDREVAATAVVEVPISQASIKRRSGPPHDPIDDAGLPIWAGVIPIETTYGEPIPAPDIHPDATEPAHLEFFRS